jgi:hypothetical protein
MLRNLRNIILPLASLVLLSGCSKTVVVTAEELCKSWRHQTVSKDDKITNDTAAVAEGNNKSRPEWGCEYGADKAKS